MKTQTEITNYFTQRAEIAKGTRQAVDASTRGSISTASFAFGGHISKGLLRRARAASSRYDAVNVKAIRREILLQISQLERLYRCSSENWERVDKILDRCHTASDPCECLSGSPYKAASLSISCWDKIQALRGFVERHGNTRDAKLLAPIFAPIVA